LETSLGYGVWSQSGLYNKTLFQKLKQNQIKKFLECFYET
jgi:hypothetical protein